MSVSSIGLQVIMPNTGTSPQAQPQRQSNERDASDMPAAAERAPAPPAMGKFIDKTV